MRGIWIGALLGAAAVTAAAGAQAQSTGFEPGIRLGYGIPMGKASDADGADLNETIKGQVPIWIDLGGRVTPNIFVGAYTTFGFGSLGDASDVVCVDGVDCNVKDFRFGAEVLYHVSPGRGVDPWFGGGLGYEWLRGHLEADPVKETTVFHGFEFLNLQVGVDFAAAQNVGIGPFLAFSMAQYSRSKLKSEGGAIDYDESVDIDDKALHQWLFLGVRGTFVL